MKEGEEIRTKQIEELEKSVQKGLEEAGLGDAGSKKMAVKTVLKTYSLLKMIRNKGHLQSGKPLGSLVGL